MTKRRTSGQADAGRVQSDHQDRAPQRAARRRRVCAHQRLRQTARQVRAPRGRAHVDQVRGQQPATADGRRRRLGSFRVAVRADDRERHAARSPPQAAASRALDGVAGGGARVRRRLRHTRRALRSPLVHSACQHATVSHSRRRPGRQQSTGHRGSHIAHHMCDEHGGRDGEELV